MAFRGFLSLFFIVCAWCPSALAALPAPGVMSLPAYGISFVPPSGWVREPLPPEDYLVTFAKIDADTHGPLAEISIRAHAASDEDSADYQGVASREHAELLPQTFDVDHEAAVGIRREHGTAAERPFLQLIATHDHRLYFLQFISYTDSLNPHEFVALVKSIRWIPVEDLLSHLGTPLTVPVFDRQATITLPSLFRMKPIEPPVDGGPQTVMFCARDADSHLVARIELTFHPSPHEGKETLALIDTPASREQFLETARRAWHLDAPPALDDTHPLPHGIITQLTNRGFLTKTGDVVHYQTRTGMAASNAGTLYLDFSIFDRTDEEAKKWDKVLLAIAQSIRFEDSASTESLSH